MIPYEFHFCSLTPGDSKKGKSFGYAHYLCLWSVIKLHPGARFYMYLNRDIKGKWFDLLRPYITIIHVEAPKEIFGQKIKKVEHQADIIRLKRLIECGGIYLDTDVFLSKPLNDLLGHNLVMGIENGMGLCNAVILAEKGSPFLIDWLQAYHPDSTRTGAGFDPDGWGEMSVKFPEYLAMDYKDYITILDPSAFYQPSGSTRGLEILFDSKDYNCDTSYGNHLWASQAWVEYLRDLTPEIVLKKQGYFYTLVRSRLTREEIQGEILSFQLT